MKGQKVIERRKKEKEGTLLSLVLDHHFGATYGGELQDEEASAKAIERLNDFKSGISLIARCISVALS